LYAFPHTSKMASGLRTWSGKPGKDALWVCHRWEAVVYSKKHSTAIKTGESGILHMNRNLLIQIKTVLAAVLITTLSGCTNMITKRNDPLTGKIVASSNQREIVYQELLDRIIDSDVIYLGENHENAEHHQNQMDIIRDLIKAGKKPQLGFEFFSIEQTGYLTTYVRYKQRGLHKLPEEAQELQLRKNLGWQDRQDRDWQFYFGFLKLARTHQLTTFGADLPKGIVRNIARNGVNGLSPVEKSLVQSTGFKNDSYKKLMFGKFKAAHCGYAHKDRQERMYETWLARNDTMARSIVAMAAESPEQPIVLIVGGGHTEHNMGVVERVKRLRPGIRQLNLGLTEIFRKPAPLEAYFQRETVDGNQFPPPHDYLWFTQRHSYEDPCERFRKHLEMMRNVKKTRE